MKKIQSPMHELLGRLTRQDASDWERLRRSRRKDEVRPALPRKRGAPPGNLNSLRHGIYHNRLVTAEEERIFFLLLQRLRLDAPLRQPPVSQIEEDLRQVALELACLYAIKLYRAMEAGDSKAAQRLDQYYRHQLAKSFEKGRYGRGEAKSIGPDATPAQWAADLLRAADEDSKIE